MSDLKLDQEQEDLGSIFPNVFTLHTQKVVGKNTENLLI